MLNKEPTLRPCPVCHTRDTRLEFPYATGPGRVHPLVGCNRCGLVFQFTELTPEELDEGQSEAYGAPQRRFNRLVEAAVRLFRGARVRLARRYLPAGGSTLDIGCGRALYLSMLRAHGYQVRGTELSEATAANAAPDIPIDTGDVEIGQYPDGSFDLISIWHVLEHLQQPDAVLSACFHALKPGGHIMIAVPNYSSAQARFGGEHWFHLDLPRHVYQFSRPTLLALLQNAGFAIVRCTTGQWEMDPFGWLQTILNRAGLRHNGLYDTLRNNPSAKRDLGLAYRLTLLVLFPLGMALAVPLSALMRAAGRAGTLIIVGHKPAH